MERDAPSWLDEVNDHVEEAHKGRNFKRPLGTVMVSKKLRP